MATHDVNLADRRGNLVESFKGYDPRVIFFYFVLAVLLLTLVGGLAYQQLLRTAFHYETERTQNQRRILVPGPRGNIYDRDGGLLVGNRARFAVVLYLDELKAELNREHVRIHNNYLATGGDKKEVPTYSQLETLARVSVAQRYLDQVNAILRRDAKIDPDLLRHHFDRELLLPFTLLNDLTPEDFARLVERLPVKSPLSVYTFNQRFYPHGALAAHTLGYVRPTDKVADEDFLGGDLTPFKMKGTIGIGGLERQFDTLLQGEAGGSVVRVDPAGYKVSSPDLPHQLPVQGKNLVTSLDLDLQTAAEEAISPADKPDLAQTGAAVAIDVNTGEVLVLASKPDYDLNKFSPRASNEIVAQMTEQGAWQNLALNGFYSPGSTFKILTSIAALRRGAITPDQSIINCDGYIVVGNRHFVCYNGLGHHGNVLLPEAIAESCDIFFYEAGRLTTPNAIAEEARRFHLDRRTGIELPNEEKRMLIPDEAWKQRVQHEGWFIGDTYNMAIGQGAVTVTPMVMACFAASVARDEVVTQPTLVHDPNRPPQHSERTGLTPVQRAALLAGMEGTTTYGTAHSIFALDDYRVPGVRIAGKTGTAQRGVKPKQINIAWFICFAPVERPEIAVAVMIVGDTVGESFEGSRHAAPVAASILKTYFEKKSRAGAAGLKPFRTE